MEKSRSLLFLSPVLWISAFGSLQFDAVPRCVRRILCCDEVFGSPVNCSWKRGDVLFDRRLFFELMGFDSLRIRLLENDLAVPFVDH